MAWVMLDGAGILPVVGKFIATRMTQHKRKVYDKELAETLTRRHSDSLPPAKY